MIFKIMNYLSLNTNFALKLQEKRLKRGCDNVYSTSERNYESLNKKKHEVVLAAMLEGKSMPAKTNHATLLKNQSAIKYLP